MALLSVTRKHMVEEAHGLMFGWEPGQPINEEYLRGMCELIARCFLKEDTEYEAEQVRKEILKRLVEESDHMKPKKRPAMKAGAA